MKAASKLSVTMAAAALLGLSALPAAAAGRLTIVEHPTDERTIHVPGGTEDAVGDTLVFANPVFDAADRKQVGSDQGWCVRTVVGKSWECFWTTILKEGLITVEGPFYDTGDSTFVVTGGSGRYAGAKGSMKLHWRDEKGSAYDFIFDLK